MQRPNYAKLHPRFSWMRDYLAQAAAPGRLPGRQDIDPAKLKAVLPFINLVDVERGPDGLRFRFRLTGTLQTEIAGREISGRYVEDAVLPAYADRICNNMRKCATTGKPVYDRFPMPHPDRDFIDTERVYFPLARDGETVDMLLILNDYPHEEEQPDATKPDRPDIDKPSALESKTPAR
ncbi:PAS domain-containing protein [Ferrovibrio sp.]|uniref:PAS domain-containing protein n=1 Tax=Ferrovibrio sp. TaxID=1917215 RepID=UPI00261CEAF8|nr:PAS domain-containing protein [Ferrovibrio sp.]